ncbi:MAG TPA: cation transporter [Gemmatimonadaceae bacterium]|jgi:divalent metal cation (Fe/Co/Zn/Cd) transporter
MTTVQALVTTADLSPTRNTLVRRSAQLNLATLAYNSFEGIIALIAGALAGSIALTGFGLDSLIEVAASLTALWRLRSDADPERRERAERLSLRVIGFLFLALSLYVGIDAARALYLREAPRESIAGIVIAALSVVVMPLLARAKRKLAVQLGSGALAAESQQTSLCAYLSAILLGGLILNAAIGWWWADPVAGLAMVPIIAREGVEGVRGRSACEDCC